MREILFRGKSAKSGKWVEGSILKTTLDGTTYNLIFGDNFIRKGLEVEALRHSCVYPETVGQFTGLTDKNGTKIFEGDIVRYADIYDYNCYLESLENPEAYEGTEYSDIWTIDEVVYGIAIDYPAFDLNRHSFEINGLSELSESGGYFYEVIGNIYDNPELLKGE